MNEMQSAMNPDFAGGMTFRDDMLTEMDIEHEIKLGGLSKTPPEELDFIRSRSSHAMSFGMDMTASIAEPAWHTVPSTYVVGTEDGALRPEAQREWAKTRATDFVEWPTDHCPQHSDPDRVVDLLARLAEENA
jgi:pimeloyl-ACP methyl ester carboxylesterase